MIPLRLWIRAAPIVAVLAASVPPAAGAEAPRPVFAQDFARACAADAPPDLAAWRVSPNLQRALWPTRLTCSGDGTGDGAAPKVLRIEVRPGDAYDPNPGNEPTERVEIQVRRELVRFERPVWYAFSFRLIEPWVGVQNRTVIHQIKQSIEPARETGHGGSCPPANPFLKIEAGYRKAVGGPAFVTKVRGTDNCGDGQSGATICGPWPLKPGRWHQVHVALTASQEKSDLRVWLDGRACAPYAGRLGYLDHGRRDADGRPTVDTQPRFGLYRDALAASQAIEFADIAFWDADPFGHPAWAALDRSAAVRR